MNRSAALAVFSLVSLLPVSCGAPPARGAADTRVLVFSRTTGFRHDSIPDGIAAIRRIAEDGSFSVDATEDPSVFTDANLQGYRVVVFLSTTGDVLDGGGEDAFERWFRGGGGFAGVHSASDTEYEWPFYEELVGAYFSGHPEIQPVAVRVEDRAHPATAALPERWLRTDEWYNFRENPRPGVHVLATLDESTYSGGTMGADHPIAWCDEIGAGRTFYTAGGHTNESYTEPLFVAHLAGAIRWASGMEPGYCGSNLRSAPSRVQTRRLPPRVVTPRG